MCKTSNSTRSRQTGGALIESLIGMVLLGVAVLGSLLSLAHSNRTQHANGFRAQVVDQLRAQFLQDGAALCGTSPTLTVNAQAVATTIQCSPYNGTTVTLPGAAAITPVVAATDTADHRHGHRRAAGRHADGPFRPLSREWPCPAPTRPANAARAASRWSP